MEKYGYAIMQAAVLFPLIAALFTLPYMLYCYRKYGAVMLMRAVCMYAFIFYMMCVYCLAILPFPKADTVVVQRTHLNLIPFSYVPEILTKTTSFSWDDVSTWLPAVYQSGLYEPLCNILMFFPMGIFLRYYFRCGKLKTTLICMGVSFFLEITQYTATYGLAPFVYRCADINDIIDNTLGGFLGFLATPLFSRFLPTTERLDQVNYQRGTRVSYIRRLFAFCIDFGMISVLSLPIALFLTQDFEKEWLISWLLSSFVLQVLVPWLWQGRTLGKAAVKVRMVDDRTGANAKLWQYALRALLLYGLFLNISTVLSPLSGMTALSSAGVAILQCFILFYLLCAAVWHGIHNEPQMSYEEMAHLKQISTVVRPAQANAAESLDAADKQA